MGLFYKQSIGDFKIFLDVVSMAHFYVPFSSMMSPLPGHSSSVLCCSSATASPDVGGGGGGGASYGGSCHIGSYFTENGKFHFSNFEKIM